MNLRAISLLTFILLLSVAVKAGDNATSKRIGDLVVSLAGVEQRGADTTGGDHYLLAIRIGAKNIGKHALCVSFASTLKATFGLQYSNTLYSKRLIIREMLPGENAEGEYLFSIKNGVEPLELALKPYSGLSQACTQGKDSLSAVWHSNDELRFRITLASNSSSMKIICRRLDKTRPSTFACS